MVGSGRSRSLDDGMYGQCKKKIKSGLRGSGTSWERGSQRLGSLDGIREKRSSLGVEIRQPDGGDVGGGDESVDVGSHVFD